MSIESLESIEEYIANDRIEELRELLSIRVLVSVICDDRTDLINEIYKLLKTTECIEQKLFTAALESALCINNNCIIDTLRIISKAKAKQHLEVEDDEYIYQLSRYPNAIYFFESVFDYKINFPWEDVLRFSSFHLNNELVCFVLDNIHFNTDELNLAFVSLLKTNETVPGEDNKTLNELIFRFISEGADVNLETDTDNGNIYLDCFVYAPTATKFFYTQDFELANLDNDEFWVDFFDDFDIDDDEYMTNYKQAFYDMKSNGIDVSSLKTKFWDLGYEDLVERLIG